MSFRRVYHKPKKTEQACLSKISENLVENNHEQVADSSFVGQASGTPVGNQLTEMAALYQPEVMPPSTHVQAHLPHQATTNLNDPMPQAAVTQNTDSMEEISAVPAPAPSSSVHGVAQSVMIAEHPRGLPAANSNSPQLERHHVDLPQDMSPAMLDFQNLVTAPAGAIPTALPSHPSCGARPFCCRDPESPRIKQNNKKRKTTIKMAQEVLAKKWGILEVEEELEDITLQKYIDIYRKPLSQPSLMAIKQLTEVAEMKRKKKGDPSSKKKPTRVKKAKPQVADAFKAAEGGPA
jgi:hypothetical protein